MLFASKSKYRTLVEEFVHSRLIDNGYRRIALEEITNNLSISKKTIYKVYKSKSEITRSIMMGQLFNIYQNLILLLQEDNTMIQKVEKLSAIIEKYIPLFNEESLKRLRKDYPDLWKEVLSFRKEKVVPLMNLLLNHSKKHGLIQDYSNGLIIELFSSSLTISTEKNFLAQNKMDFQTAFRIIFDIVLNGIITRKGRKLLAINQRIKNERN